ncbi:hypothetical protein [Candidatus Cytomitobacter primus]|uniref:Uncharacterized protein n=1 Tax=Candidatus Cytomitobacter primus TaxID=2066024 RepID=A0A5C0UE83_9PROT|nr:hypothetical protein [Candidatus Cytomitobacter primus]QEK38395.1 hypothetical protein FZC34_00470 [Candidatus Cytomitobacter primus]
MNKHVMSIIKIINNKIHILVKRTTYKLYKRIICICDISYTIIISIINSYIAFVKSIILNRNNEQVLSHFDLSGLSQTNKSLLSIWITLTPGTIAFVENEQDTHKLIKNECAQELIEMNEKHIVIVHSMCGNVTHDINQMICKIQKWSKIF